MGLEEFVKGDIFAEKDRAIDTEISRAIETWDKIYVECLQKNVKKFYRDIDKPLTDEQIVQKTTQIFGVVYEL